jgi:hypothetical protein
MIRKIINQMAALAAATPIKIPSTGRCIDGNGTG